RGRLVRTYGGGTAGKGSAGACCGAAHTRRAFDSRAAPAPAAVERKDPQHFRKLPDAALGRGKRMGRTAHPLERTGGALESESRLARTEASQLPRRRPGEADARAHLPLPQAVRRDRATWHLPLRADRHGLEHVAIARRLISRRCIASLPFFSRPQSPGSWNKQNPRAVSIDEGTQLFAAASP